MENVRGVNNTLNGFDPMAYYLGRTGRMPVLETLIFSVPQGYLRYFEGWTQNNEEMITKLAAEQMHEYLYAPQQRRRVTDHHPPGGDEYSGLPPMPSWMRGMADRIREQFGEPVNHAIMVRYKNGVKQHAPPHKDNINPDTSFFVVSFGTPSNFQILETVQVDSKKRLKDGEIKRTGGVPGEVVWERALASGSLLKVSGAANERYYHAVPPQDSSWSGGGPPRYSLTFCTIDTERTSLAGPSNRRQKNQQIEDNNS